MTLLSVENVAAHYGASQALFGVSLTVAEGEVVALMGRNGMGKSTTVKTICKLLPLSAGAIRLGDQDLARLADLSDPAIEVACGSGGRFFVQHRLRPGPCVTADPNSSSSHVARRSIQRLWPKRVVAVIVAESLAFLGAVVERRIVELWGWLIVRIVIVVDRRWSVEVQSRVVPSTWNVGHHVDDDLAVVDSTIAPTRNSVDSITVHLTKSVVVLLLLFR